METLEIPSWATVEPALDYHNRQAMTSSRLKVARKSLKQYHQQYILGVKRIETVAMRVGTIIHTIALEGIDALGEKYFILGEGEGPINTKRTGKLYGRDTKAFGDWMEENAAGREVVLQDDIETAKALHEHPFVNEMLISSGFAELSVIVEMHGMTCQCRPDRIFIITGDYLFELKSCQDINWFPYHYKEFGYQYQNAWYREVLMEAAMKKLDVFVGAVEKTPAKRVGAWHVDPKMLDECAEINDNTLLAIKNSNELNIWPAGHLEGMGELNSDTVGKPRWE